MSAAPDVAPVAVWDTRDRDWWYQHNAGASEWAMQHIDRAESTYRIEFYVLDLPFAVVYRYARDRENHPLRDPAGDGPLREAPVAQMLDELPSLHLLGPPHDPGDTGASDVDDWNPDGGRA